MLVHAFKGNSATIYNEISGEKNVVDFPYKSKFD